MDYKKLSESLLIDKHFKYKSFKDNILNVEINEKFVIFSLSKELRLTYTIKKYFMSNKAIEIIKSIDCNYIKFSLN